MEKTYKIRFAPIVDQKDLLKLDIQTKERILKTLFEKLISKKPQSFSKPLKNTLRNFRKLRVGSYRIIFKVNEDIIEILVIAIGHRSQIYEKIKKRL